MSEQMEIVNFSYLNMIGQNNDDFLLKMIDTFLLQCPVELGLLEEAVLNENWEETAKVAHRFVTSVRFMGMEDIAKKLKALENNAKEGINLEESIDSFTSIKQTCILAIEELETKKRVLL